MTIRKSTIAKLTRRRKFYHSEATKRKISEAKKIAWQHFIATAPIEEVEERLRKMGSTRPNTLNEKYNDFLKSLGLIENVHYTREKCYRLRDENGVFACLVDFVLYPSTPNEICIELQGCWYHRCRCVPCKKKKNVGRSRTITKSKRKIKALRAADYQVYCVWEHNVDAYFSGGSDHIKGSPKMLSAIVEKEEHLGEPVA